MEMRKNDEGQQLAGFVVPGIYGYDCDPVTGERTIIESEAAIVRLVFEWDAAAWSERAIAKELNERGVPTRSGNQWSARTVRGVLSRTSYIGVDYYGKCRCGVVYSRRNTNNARSFGRTRRLEGRCLIANEGGALRIVSDEAFEKADPARYFGCHLVR